MLQQITLMSLSHHLLAGCENTNSKEICSPMFMAALVMTPKHGVHLNGHQQMTI